MLVTDLDVKPFNTLSALDAQRDGFDTLADLQRALITFIRISDNQILLRLSASSR